MSGDRTVVVGRRHDTADCGGKSARGEHHRYIVLARNAAYDDSGSVNYAVFFVNNPIPFLTSRTRGLDLQPIPAIRS